MKKNSNILKATREFSACRRTEMICTWNYLMSKNLRTKYCKKSKPSLLSLKTESAILVMRLWYDYMISRLEKFVFITSSLIRRGYAWFILDHFIWHKLVFKGSCRQLCENCELRKESVKKLYKTGSSIRRTLWLVPRGVRLKRFSCTSPVVPLIEWQGIRLNSFSYFHWQ